MTVFKVLLRIKCIIAGCPLEIETLEVSPSDKTSELLEPLSASESHLSIVPGLSHKVSNI